MISYIIGIDEAGRGPLAGPITLAAVAVPSKLWKKLFQSIRDSKKLTEKKRLAWFSLLKTHPKIITAVSSVGPKLIDKIGISRAVKIGIARLLQQLAINPKIIFLDGSLFAPKEFPQKTVTKGDQKIPIIAAASIIAKVTRDRKMIRLSKKFPEYGFHIHKGYGTKMHRRLIRKHGLSPIHRRGFCNKFL